MIRYYACSTCGEIHCYNMLPSGYADFPPQELIRHFHGGKPGIKTGFKSETAARRWLERERQAVEETDDNTR